MMEANFSIFHTQIAFLLGLLVAVAVLVYIARRINVAYPVLLVLGGLVLGLIPGLPTIELKPDIVFLLFMPPLLYWESLTIPIRDLRKNLRPIASLAIGLVLFTDVAVAWVAHAVTPGLSWPAAFILGAVVASTDEVAVAEISRHLRLPHRVMAVLEGESLLNDAVSVVAFRMAVGAAVTGFFSLAQAGLQFLTVGLGGIAIGLSLGWCIVKVRRLLYDAAVENTISLLTPFAAYLLAESVSVSGIIAVVSVGLYLEKHIPRIVSPRSRLQAQGFWQ
ncbi:MAG TPA: cation:proton antiporter, partial [Methylophilaceae bacterium]|nr:cation:proton antiporter [Methylophilaceae bacterium]